MKKFKEPEEHLREELSKIGNYNPADVSDICCKELPLVVGVVCFFKHKGRQMMHKFGCGYAPIQVNHYHVFCDGRLYSY